ncbi:hypothetical protein Tco_0669784 [Tanacetum coccineum]
MIKAVVPLLGKLGAEVDEPMVGRRADEVAEPIVEMEEQVIAPVIDVEEDIVMLFGDGDFSDDDSKGFNEDVRGLEEHIRVGSPSTCSAKLLQLRDSHLTLPKIPPGFLYSPLRPVIEDLSTRMGNLEYGHGQLVKKVIQVKGTCYGLCLNWKREIPDGSQAMGKTPSRSVLRWSRQRDVQIPQLQTMVSEMSSRESTLMHCILGMDRRLADLERRPQGPQ